MSPFDNGLEECITRITQAEELLSSVREVLKEVSGDSKRANNLQGETAYALQNLEQEGPTRPRRLSQISVPSGRTSLRLQDDARPARPRSSMRPNRRFSFASTEYEAPKAPKSPKKMKTSVFFDQAVLVDSATVDRRSRSWDDSSMLADYDEVRLFHGKG